MGFQIKPTYYNGFVVSLNAARSFDFFPGGLGLICVFSYKQTKKHEFDALFFPVGIVGGRTAVSEPVGWLVDALALAFAFALSVGLIMVGIFNVAYCFFVAKPSCSNGLNGILKSNPRVLMDSLFFLFVHALAHKGKKQ